YPILNIYDNPHAEKNINNQIRMEVDEYFKYAANILYGQAVNVYKDSLKNDFPFHSFEADMRYTITYNDNCFLSLYTDIYEFTGGAHGNTVRTSNTWNLCSGENVYLSYFFDPYTDYVYFITQEIIAQ